MARYRKKPVEIDAVEFLCIHTDEDGFQEVEVHGVSGSEKWFREALEKGIGEVGGVWVLHGTLCVGTLEGTMRADPGDYLIRGIIGELYPCKREIFDKTYDLVSYPIPNSAKERVK